MKSALPIPNEKSIIFQNKKLYVCLATYPITEGHTVIVWKKHAKDLHLLNKKDYQYLMNIIDLTRNALLKTLKLKKIYLIYMDEANQVHWHLIPRYNKKGYNILKHNPNKLKDFSLTEKIKKNFKIS